MNLVAQRNEQMIPIPVSLLNQMLDICFRHEGTKALQYYEEIKNWSDKHQQRIEDEERQKAEKKTATDTPNNEAGATTQPPKNDVKDK